MAYLHHQNRSVIKVSGTDTISFLQGVLTNDITQLKAQGIMYALMLTPQGRYHFDALLYHYGDEDVYIETDKETVDTFLKRLRLYKLRADVTLDLMDHNTYVMTAPNPDHPALKPDPRSHALGYRGICFDADGLDFVIDTAAYDLQCVKLCIPRTGIELIAEKTIPLEANMEDLNALCFDKGCYLGQELTTRTKHQGLIRKKLYTVHAVTHKDVQRLPLTLYANEQKVGELYSLHKGYGIAKLRIEHIHKGIILTDTEQSVQFTLG